MKTALLPPGSKIIVVLLAICLLGSAARGATVTSPAISPSVPTDADPVTVSATVKPATGSTLSGVQLTWNTGAVTTSTAFQETMNTTPTAQGWTGTGAQYAWTVTANRNGADARQRAGTANHTAPVVLTSCTTNGTVTVTCASTARLWPGMTITGTNLAAGTTVASVTNTTTFVLNTAATGSGTGLTLTAAGVTLTNCAVSAAGTTVTCDSTVGLVAGMGITGVTTNPVNPTVASITDTKTFVLSFAATTAATGLTLTASGCGLEFTNGTSLYTDTMAATAASINAAGASSGYVEFYVSTSGLISGNGWTLQVSPDGGTTWNTRVTETYDASTITLTGSALNATTTVTCASTAGLAQGMVVQGTTASIAGCGTTTGSTNVTCTNTAGLAVGMFITGTGVPNNARITALTPNTSFTLSAAATATGTVAILANFLPANTTIASVTNSTTFLLSTAAFYTGGSLTLYATTVNHAFALKHYDLLPAELTSGLRLRYQLSGYVAVPPARAPTCDIDDIVVMLTTGVPPSTVAMVDGTGNGGYSAIVPKQTAGSTVSYTITATDSTGPATASGSWTTIAAAPVLSVSPATGLSSSGLAGGPFTPASAQYTITNTGVGPLTWAVSHSAAWLSLSASGGTLAAGATTTVTASINSAANALATGSYTDTLSFTNTTTGSGNTSLPVTLAVLSAPATPVLTAVAASLNASYDGLSWPDVAGATSYLVQVSLNSTFSSPLVNESVTSARVSFANLVDGTTYYYRVAAVNSVGTSPWSTTVSAVQDATAPSISITSPATGTTTANSTVTVTGTSSDATSGIASVRVNNVAATTTNGYATWTATVPVGYGTNVITARAVDNAGNPTTTASILVTSTAQPTYNPLYIPDLLRGPSFNLTLDPATKQFFSGVATQTYSYNHALFWGPTLVMRQGDFIQVQLSNNLPASTTTHWHGFHIPAIMDGGPHEVIPSGTVWTPSFYMKNRAATYWYHPHLHTTTQQQLTLGAGGLIIVQDAQEAALPLPRTYGVDDFPIILTSRRLISTQGNGANQFALNGAYGDFMVVNGTLNPVLNLPAQIVRLRILNAEIARNHNLGFSDGRTFYVIASDGGLLNAPVPVTRLVMACAERYEILVNLSDLAPGASLDLMTYNSNMPGNYSGGQPITTGANGSLLNNLDFPDLHISIVAATAHPIASIPATLANNTYWTQADVTNNRAVSITGVGGAPLGFDNLVYSASTINQTLNYNAVEQWTLSNVSNLDHTFHIHDIQFWITSMTGGIPAYMQGWKDTFYIPTGTSVSFIAKFDDFASNVNPFMFHCHFLQHEDAGLMGQFLVQNNAVEDIALASFTRTGSNPAVHLQFKTTPGTTYTVQYSTDLTTGSWVDVGSVTSNGTTADFYESDAGRLSQGRGFYRVAMPVVTQ